MIIFLTSNVKTLTIIFFILTGLYFVSGIKAVGIGCIVLGFIQFL